MVNIIFYRNETGVQLGRISKHHMHEIVIPAFSGKYPVFLNRRFEEHPEIYYWEVTNQAIIEENNDTIIKIYLKPDLDNVKSFGHYALDHRQKQTSHFIKKYNVVDVDFGHHINLLDEEGKSVNNSYISHLLQYELHKRRPCIVLGSDDHIVQVIPLTSKSRSEKYLLSEASLMDLASRYRQNRSYILPKLIQSVSAFRVFPVRLKEDKYAKVTDAVKIQRGDIDRIESMLSLQFKPSIGISLKPLERRIEELQQERGKNLGKIKESNEQIQELKQLLEDVGRKLGEDGTQEDVLEALKNLTQN